MSFVKKEAHEKAINILKHFEKELTAMREDLKILPTLTSTAEAFVGMAAAKEGQKKYLGRILHQWHAHGDLPWLTERNVVGAFEALVYSKSVEDMGDFCTWIGDLRARMHAFILESPGSPSAAPSQGAWDARMPRLFWGDAYTKFLLGEASRSAPVFHKIAQNLVDAVGGSVFYTKAPNKNYSRISKKQVEYATFGLLAFHVALDHMSGCFRRVIRADLDGEPDEARHVKSRTGAVLVVGSLAASGRSVAESFDNIELAVEAGCQDYPSSSRARDGRKSSLTSEWQPLESRSTSAVMSAQISTKGKLPVLVLLMVDHECRENLEEGKARLLDCGADVVLGLDGPLEATNVRNILSSGLAEAYSARGVAAPVPEKESSPEKLQLLFEMQKSQTRFKPDLLCAGGLLDLVRGSICCSTEQEVRAIYDAALALTLHDDSAEVVRVKNGFHTPVTGGYADLKLFVQVAHDSGESAGESTGRVCHICELQVHLASFLEKKKFTHMPYVIDRGDFDLS
jgi:hypothetical protein